MPKVTTEIPEVEESIKRPIVFDVIREMIKQTGLDPNTPILYAGETSTSIPQVGSTLDDSNDPYNAQVRLPSQDRLIISVTEDYPEETGMTMAINRPEVPTFFADTGLSVYMKPVYETTLFTISVRYRALTKTQADKWRNNLYRSIGKMKMGYQHQIQYHYPLPNSFMYLLYVIWQMREANLPLNEALGAYIKRCMDPRFTVITNQAGKAPTLVMRESQVCVIGNYEIQDAAKFDRDDSTNTWETGFDYTFTADVCHQCWMEYPLMVHNQLIPSQFYTNPWPVDWRDFIHQTSLSKWALDKISDPIQVMAGGVQGISIPYFDDWLPGQELPQTIMIARILLQVDQANPQNILNLGQLGDFVWDSDVLAYMTAAYQGLAQWCGAAITVTLYRGSSPLASSMISIDNQLNITSVYPLDPTAIYHLVVSFNTNLIDMPLAAKMLLASFGTVAIKIFTILKPRLAANSGGFYADMNIADSAFWTGVIGLPEGGSIPALNSVGGIPTALFNGILTTLDMTNNNSTPSMWNGSHSFNAACLFITSARSNQ